MPRRAEDKEVAIQIAKRLGDRARTARSRLDLTQEELSEIVGITAEALGRIERGAALPSFPTLLRLCAALRVSPSDLLAHEMTLGGVTISQGAPSKTRELQQIARYAPALDRRRQRLLLLLARELRSLTRRTR